MAWGALVLSAVALAGLAVSGYLGGELAYRYGVRVADEATQAHGYQATSTTRTTTARNTAREERI